LYPISYTIGISEPHKQIWILALFLHFPSRVLFIMMFPQQWHTRFWRSVQIISSSLEVLGLILVTIFYMDSIVGFKSHEACFGMWLGASIWAMSVVIHLQR
ncbi:hypothetical protein PFISCL1PPCAC_11087, partial [Pristionchus fissidentatus]